MRRAGPISASAFFIVTTSVCVRSPVQMVLTAEMPLHLEDHLDAAKVIDLAATDRSEASRAKPVEWLFAQSQPHWVPIEPNPNAKIRYTPATVEQTADALRVRLKEDSRQADKLLRGGIYTDLPDWRREDWLHVLVRARSSTVTTMIVGVNPPQPPYPAEAAQISLAQRGGITPIVSDGSVQTYEVRLNWGNSPTGSWTRLGLEFRSSDPGNIDILSVTVVPISALYSAENVGSRSVAASGTDYRRTVFTHAPSRLEFTIRVPESGRLYTALGSLNRPVDFRVTAGAVGAGSNTLLRETNPGSQPWAERSVDLAAYAGQTITLGLETTSEEAGAIAFWGSPLVTGVRRTDKPNVIFYIIDGGGADQMSLYGYNRPTTPNLDRLAREGAVFERAYSTSLWTGPSTATFMTSLHNSVLGNTFRGALPSEQAPTMAQRFHDARYATAVFTSNPNAGTLSNLQRGVDVFRDHRSDPPTGSSVELHRAFWTWQTTASPQPYWVHFQTTDVHRPHVPPPPFAGLFAPGGHAQMTRWTEAVTEWSQRHRVRESIEDLPWEDVAAETGISRQEYYQLVRSLYDESLAHQDQQLGRLVERLRQSGEWERTLLVIASDHSVNRGSIDFIARLGDELPPAWSMNGAIQTPIFRPSRSRVPLVFIWPGHITGGQRLRQPVSLIDVMPTVLELAGLPALAVQQGQSLAPLLLGRGGWRDRPVIFDEFRGDTATRELYGAIEVIDTRWGASLWVGPRGQHRPARLLLYDLWNDPQALTPINDARPDLVKKYTEFLEDRWMSHQALAKTLAPGGQTTLAPGQLERLRSLGYIR